MADKQVVDKDVDVDVNVDKDIDLDKNVDVNIEHEFEFEYDKDVNYDSSHTTIYAFGVDKDAEVKVTKVDVDKDIDIDIEKDIDIDYDKDVDIDIDKSTTNETWNVNVNVNSENIIQNSDITEFFDEDVNDIDNQDLISVEYGSVDMDDFSSDQTAIGNSFNGLGNDLQFDVNQSNQLEDNDNVSGTTATYTNAQAPNADLKIDAEHEASAKAQADGSSGYEHGYWSTENGDYVTYDYGKYAPEVTKGWYTKDTDAKHSGYSSYWYGAEASTSSSLWVDLSLSAPTDAFQTVEAEGGTSEAGDGIKDATIKDADGDVDGSTSASADAAANAEAFTVDITAGGNQQANFATVNIVGGDQDSIGDGPGYPPADGYANGDNGDHKDDGNGGDAGGLAIKDSWIYRDHDNDVNDLDSYDLIDVSNGSLTMDDFDLDVTAIGNSFNGPGNDMQFDVNQTNDLVDNDTVADTHVAYNGSFWNGPFQDVSADGGDATAGNGIGWMDAQNTDGISGSAAASADASASAEAFTAGIVVGANLQVNSFSATVVGGDSFSADDLDG